MKRLLLTAAAALTLATASAQDDTVDFGYVEWPGVTVKTRVATEILEALGYETDTSALSLPLVLKGLSEGDLDAFLAVWLPTMHTMTAPYMAEEGDGSITPLARNLEPTIYRPAVPAYVAEQGIASLADVAANADMFDGRIYGIEPGNDANEIIRGMIEDDVYGFSSLDLVESSTQGMLSAVERATEREEPIAFIAWSPHWMNSVHDIVYLDDPEGVFGDDGYVLTVANTEWAEANPNVARFLEQLVVTPEMQNRWIDAYSREGNEPERVAEAWIAGNLDVVDGWLEGVTTASGEDAAEAVRSAFGD